MTPRPEHSPLGWQGPARGLLIALAVVLASALAWASRAGPAGEVEVPTLSVDPNIAPLPVLMALPMIGPVLAGAIVEAREAAPFRSIDDFDRRVRGIGPARVAALRPFLRFEPSPVSPR